MKRIVSILLLIVVLCGCAAQEPEAVELSFATAGKANFSLIVSSESETASDLGRTVSVALRNVTGASYSYSTDARRPDPGPQICEILIGKTDRPESQKIYGQLSAPGDYVICVEGNKLVIAAGSDIALLEAVDVFLQDILHWQNKNDYEANEALSVRSDLKLTGSLEVQQNGRFNMTQEQIDAQFGPILDGLFAGKTTQTIIRDGIGQQFFMHFPDLLCKDGTYYAYYISYATKTGKGGVGLATSTDGIKWNDQGCVIQPDTDYDRNGAYFAGVWLDEDGTYYLVYESKGDAESDYGTRENIALATSADGVNWTKQGLILRRTDSIPWLRVNVGTPDLFKAGDIWYLTFHGFDGVDCQIGVAYGKDLHNLTVVPQPVIPTQDGTLWSGTTGRRDVIYVDGWYYMVYEISTDQNPTFASANWTHMFARSRDMLNWEITAGPLLTQKNAGFGYDGPCWLLHDGHLYVLIRSGVWTMLTELTLPT